MKSYDRYYRDNPKEIEDFVNGIADDELTKGRIRTIAVQIKYGGKSIDEIAEYYGLPRKAIDDIAKGKIFSEITKDLIGG